MAQMTLILGGVRSGKSRFAQQLAERIGGPDVLFLATAEAGDGEMARRIERHQRSRPDGWGLLEKPLGAGQSLAGVPDRYRVVLVDCLTLLVSNLLLSEGDAPREDEVQQRVQAELDSLLQAGRRRPGTVILVSGEVGLGLVPDNPLGRIYRDLLGWANQTAAAEADAVYAMVAGLPVEIKTLADTLEQAAVRCCNPPRP